MYKLPKRRQLTKAERLKVYGKCEGHCAYCGCDITLAQMQVDHKQPISRGGTDVMGNYLPACRSCNNYKNTMTVEQFRMMAGRWHDALLRDSAAYRMAVRFGRIVPQMGKVEFYFEKETNEP